MTWTSENPKKSGYYWLRNYHKRDHWQPPAEPTLVEVYAENEEFYYAGNDQATYFDEIVEAEWYGPLEPPV